MKKRFNVIRNEDGALTFEFLGILPFFFLFFIILWQIVASGYAVFTVKTAINEGAKVYAVTQSEWEAEEAVGDAIGGTSVVNLIDVTVNHSYGTNQFEIEVDYRHPLVFIPSRWRESASILLEEKLVSRVLLE